MLPENVRDDGFVDRAENRVWPRLD